MQLQLQPRALPAALRTRGHCARSTLRAASHTQGRACPHLHTGHCQGRHLAMNHEHSLVQLKGGLVCSSSRIDASETVQDVRSVQVGSVVTGLVTKIVPFGAFVDIDGVTGLVHVSQISEDYVEHPEEVLSVGDEVTALVRRVEPHTGRVALSIRALERAQKAMQRNTKLKALRGKEDDRLPDHVQPHSVQVGDCVKGVVVSLQSYGAMVDVGGAIGLLHITQISGTRVDAVSEVFSVGEQLQALVVGIDPASGRLSLSTRALEATRGDMLTNRQAVVEGAAEMAAQWRAQREAQQAESTDAGQRAQGRDVNTALASVKVGSVVTGVVVDVARDCASVALDGITGTLHKSRMGLDKVDDVREKLSIGDYVVVEVLKLDLGKRRASVSMKALGSSTGEMQEGLQEGDVVTGMVTSVDSDKAWVDVNGTPCVLARQLISRHSIESVEDLLAVGEQVTALVHSAKSGRKYDQLSTSVLERNSGDMLINRQAVWDSAEEMAARWRQRRTAALAARAEVEAAAAEGRDPRASMQVGDLVTGVVVKSASRFALVAVGGAECHLHESQVSGHAFKGMYKVLSVGEQVTALVIDFHLSDGQVELSTKDLERNPGDMLTNRQAVWDGAEEMAAQWRERQSLLTAAS